MPSQTVYLIRHGEVDGNVFQLDRMVTVREFNSIVDQVAYESINELGIQQVTEVAPKVADLGLSHLYCSPLARAQETAKILHEKTGLPIITREDLYEVIPARLNEPPEQTLTLKGAYVRSGLRLINPFTRDTETFARAFFRMRRIWREMTREHKTDFGIVGHQGIFRALFVWIHMSPTWHLVKGDTSNCGISIVSRRR